MERGRYFHFYCRGDIPTVVAVGKGGASDCFGPSRGVDGVFRVWSCSRGWCECEVWRMVLRLGEWDAK